MERITRRLSMHRTIKSCSKCKEYKSCNANLIQIIQEQNNKLEKLQKQLRRMTGEHESSTHDSTQQIRSLKKSV